MQEDTNDQSDDLVVDELADLKERADLMGITYHPSIGLEKLRAKVNATVNGDDKEQEADDKKADKKGKEPKAETENEMRVRVRDDATALVRIRVTCMNPAKREWEGEIFATGNSLVGTLKKYVPFNVDDGWHVPRMIYNMIKERQCQIFVSSKDSRGNTVRQGKMIKEFAVEVLPDLTQEDLHDLAQRQALSQSVG